MKQQILNLLRDSLPEIIGGLTVAAVVIALSRVRRVRQAIRKVAFKKKMFDDYFLLKSADRVDYVVYQLGLRSKIPFVDLLYLEFLHHLLLIDRLGEIIIFPSIYLGQVSKQEQDFQTFKENALRIFSKYKRHIRIVHPFEVTINAQDLLSPDFLETVKYIGSERFIRFLRDRFGMKIRNFHDFNKFFPEDMKLLNIYDHLIRGCIISRYLRENKIIDDEPLILGFMIWETEVAKLGLFQRISEHADNIVLTPIIGKTIYCGKNKTIPVYDPKDTLYIFEKGTDILLKLAKKNDRELRKYIEILTTILEQNYRDKIDLKFASTEGYNLFQRYVISKASDLANVKKLKSKGYAVFHLIHRLRERYGFK